MKRLTFLLSAIIVLLSGCVEVSPDVRSARALIDRVVPEWSGRIAVSVAPSDSSDYVTLESRGGKLHIVGNNANSIAVGLNHYLKYYCHSQYSWLECDALELPAKMPRVPAPVRLNARVSNRFFMNYCTFGYTLVWWGWKEWEHFIDWMALNGINLPLAITGQESVWYKIWTEMGLSDEEIRSYFTAPAHLPWHRMQNLDGWGSPLPKVWLDNQEELQKLIVARERELNMRPVLPAFAGHVPKGITRIYPDAPVSLLGNWAPENGFTEDNICTFLDPMADLYSEIQKKFIEKETELYGSDHVYGLDLFNEMVPPSWDGDYLARVSNQVYTSLEAADPEAVWLQMTWLFYYKRDIWMDRDENGEAWRIKSYLKSVPDDRQLLLDYWCEHMPIWEKSNKYFNVPFIWCYLGNFGGNSMLSGNFETTNERFEHAYEAAGGNLAGIGSTLEGFNCNPYIYEYVFEKAWDNPLTQNVEAWGQALADQRAGFESEEAREAWKMLLDSVYVLPANCMDAVMINRRPTMKNLDKDVVVDGYKYGNKVLLDVLDRLVASGSHTRAMSFDMVNITRQMLGNLFSDLFNDYRHAYAAGEYALMPAIEKEMTAILEDMETLLRTQKCFLTGCWIESARAIGETEEEKDYFESNARDIISTWGDKGCPITDYASRSWAGLTETYYAPRWTEFFKRMNTLLDAGRKWTDADEDDYVDFIGDHERNWWVNRPGTFITEPEGDPVTTSSALVEKYRQSVLARR